MTERLTIDEIIERCKGKAEIDEKVFNSEILQNEDMHFDFMKEYWEHKQVAEYLEELKHFRDLKAQGRLQEFPCSLGDRLYWILEEYEDEKPVYEINQTNPVFGIVFKEDGFYVFTEPNAPECDKIGSEWALLTEDDAKKKVEEMRKKKE